MSALYVTNVDDDPKTSNSCDKTLGDNNFENQQVEPTAMRGNLKQRNYILNDVGALKKKLKAEVMKHEVAIGKEAKDASNITVPMKASFFEFVKAHFINDLMGYKDIVKVDNAEGVKAATENFGDAFVEYLMEITFKVNKHVHCVKLTAYTTTSQLVFQPVGEKSGPKEHLDQKGTPRFFVENFLLPWCNKAISEKRYNEVIATKYYNALKEEIKKLDIMKLDQKKASKGIPTESIGFDSVTKHEAKCAAKVCNFQGINPHNKAAVGVCAKCGNTEHFACVKIKSDHKEDIIRGIQKYFCSTCFTRNPSLIIPDTRASVRPRLDSLPIMGQGYLKLTHSTTAKPVLEDHNMETKKCDVCNFETNSLQEMRMHIDTVHKPTCTECKKTFKTTEELIKHIDMEHNIQCNICDINFTTEESLNEHKQNMHEHVCQHCDSRLSSADELKNHMDTQHKVISPTCSTCHLIFNSEDELLQHIGKEHEINPGAISVASMNTNSNDTCNLCAESFSDEGSLSVHVKETHTYSCNHCEAVKTTKDALEEHIKEAHTFLCLSCDICFSTDKEYSTHKESAHKPKGNETLKCHACEIILSSIEDIKQHLQEEHSHECEKCDKNFKTKTLLREHITDTHQRQTSHQCKFCDEKLIDQEVLKEHVQNNHTFDCEMCGHTGIGEEVMEDHILEKHAQPDNNGLYKCDDCTFQTKEKTSFGTHFKLNHGSKSKRNSTSLKKETELENELRQLKNNLGRLETMYHEALEENNNIKSEYEAKLITANDNLTVAKAENEALAEKVDILFKLGRSYLNQNKTVQNNDTQDKITEEIIEIDAEQTDVSLESLENWTKKKLRGFKRVNPTSRAEKPLQANSSQSVPNKHHSPSSSSSSSSKPNTSSSSPTSPVPPNTPDIRSEIPQSEREENGNRGKYCHFFVNSGKCNYEERTGNRCKFLHMQAPMCRSGTSCSRPKCMFSHPKVNGISSFLGNPNPREYSMPINPWQLSQVVNPWMIPQPNQYVTNHWGLEKQNSMQNIWNTQRTGRSF